MRHHINGNQPLNHIMIIGMLLTRQILHLIRVPVTDRAHSRLLHSNVLSLKHDQVVTTHSRHLLGLVHLGLQVCALLRCCETLLCAWVDLHVGAAGLLGGLLLL